MTAKIAPAKAIEQLRTWIRMFDRDAELHGDWTDNGVTHFEAEMILPGAVAIMRFEGEGDKDLVDRNGAPELSQWRAVILPLNRAELRIEDRVLVQFDLMN